MSASSPPPADAAPATAAGAEPEPEAATVVWYCYECHATVSLPAPPPAPSPSRLLLCPRCRSDYLEENPNPSPSSPPPPPPPPPPGLLTDSGSSSSGEEDTDGLDGLAHSAAHAHLSQLVRRLYDDPTYVATAAAAAVSALRQQGRIAGQGQPPATPASIAALPTVQVSEPAAVCAICKDDLPLAAAARRLPCGHLYHSTCIVQWLQMHNSCPVCRYCLPSTDHDPSEPSELDQTTTQITIRFTTNRRRNRGSNDAAAAAPVATSPTQLAQAMTGEGGSGPANSAETVSSEWPPPPESDAVMSEARQEEGFLDWPPPPESDAVMSEAPQDEDFLD
ncbi:E3 ubiquitin-protein ligase RING1-like [Lolium rigidum]|uniref:E3 ubiquitin-protein ligase RING1-like n=1 Tax=Lolium rigidum TaxID=89674 RepID=UPI001F5D6366|nr:E3 ubiquitin-protein ligase RING1-like [Lolium rigidum]